LKRAVLVGLVLLIAGAAPAEEMKGPQISVARIDWDAASASLAERGPGTPAESFARLNAIAEAAFPGIANSTVPVLLPFDIDGFAKDLTANPGQPPDKMAESADRFMRADFQATKFFLTGPAGYDTAFGLVLANAPGFSDIRYAEPVYVLLSGLGMTYQLDGPSLPGGELVKSLQRDFPGIRRYLHESYIRYSFERYGVTYVAAIYCRDTRPRAKILTCRQADRVMDRFLRVLKLAGGTPAANHTVDVVPLDRPKEESKDFTYFSPGLLIPNTGLKKDTGGRADYTVYARLRFPLKDKPAFANSQSFNNWGDCDFTGRSVRNPRRKDQPYSCNVNGRPLVFNESAPSNYSYPWRDNFCEHRRFFVGQCPGGEGHQGQDIRPSSCTLFNHGADRCQPYQHEVVAAHDGFILRARKQEAVYLFINTPSTHVRVRYMHMNPNQLDADGIVSGKLVHEGDLIGKVGNYNNRERGTTYHLHFDMQVPTKLGWVFVNPYMTLVAAYERLIGARGTEVKESDPVPAVAGLPPVILHPSGSPAVALAPPVHTEESAAVRAKPHKAKAKAKGKAKAKAKAKSQKKGKPVKKNRRRG
jgi:murein DD-endopeptidase MepM/ murein hydrolase activator NlpD